MNLPFSPQAPQTPFIQVNYNNLFLPPLSYLPPQLNHVYPFIVGQLMDISQSKATVNPLRMFLYNQISANGYQNQQFAALVEYTVRVIEMRAAQGVNDLQQLVIQCAELCLENQAAGNMSNYPELAQWIDQNIASRLGLAFNNMAALNVELNKFSMMKQNQMQGNVPYNNPQIGGGYQQNNQITYTQPMGGYQQNNNQFNQRQQVTSQVSNNGNSGLFNHGSMNNQFNQPMNNANTGRFSRFTSDEPQQSQPIQPQQVVSINPVNNAPIQSMPRQPSVDVVGTYKPTYARHNYDDVVPNDSDVFLASSMNNKNNDVIPVISESTEIKCEPDTSKALLFAYDPNKYTHKLVPDQDGIIVQKLTKLERNEMNQNEHGVTPSYVSNPVMVADNATTVKEVDLTLDNLPKIPTIVFNEGSELHELSTSIDEIKFQCDICLLSLIANTTETNEINIFRKHGILLEPVVSLLPIGDFISGLSLHDTFASMQAALSNASDSIRTGHHTDVDRNTLMVINKRLTDSVNYSLRNELGLSVDIDDFIEDINGLFAYLMSSSLAGETIHNYMYDNQARILKRCLYVSDDVIKQQLEDGILPEGDNIITPYTEYFTSKYTMTALSLYSNELSLEIPEIKRACIVDSNSVPVFYQIAHKVITTSPSDSFNYIKTRDGVVFEVLTGGLNKECILVRVVK